jgi:hypothetical protein
VKTKNTASHVIVASTVQHALLAMQIAIGSRAVEKKARLRILTRSLQHRVDCKELVLEKIGVTIRFGSEIFGLLLEA